MHYLTQRPIPLPVFSISLIYRPIPGHLNYEISSTGTVRNIVTGCILKPFLRKSSVRYYLVCSIGRINRLQMSALLGRQLRPGELVRHMDGGALDNSPGNLRVGNAAANAIDKIRDNTNGRKLRNADVREIRHLASRRTRKQIAHQFGITPGHVGAIIVGTRWRNLP